MKTKVEIKQVAEEMLLKEEENNHMRPENIIKITFLSDIICYGPGPENGYEYKQRLTVRKEGSLRLTRCFFGEKDRVERRNIDLAKQKKLFQRTLEYFLNYKGEYWTDCGSWNLDVYFDNGSKMNLSGPYGCEPDGYSKFVRELLGRSDLLLCREE